jgi:hypothetical protein
MATAQQESTNQESANQQNPFAPWMETYQKWTDESLNAFQQSMQQAQKMNPMFNNPELMKLWQDQFQSFTDKVRTTDWQHPSSPENFKKIYDTWLESASAQMDTMMRTEAFAAKSGKDLEQFADYKKKMGEMLEAYWESLHLPNSSDMREVYHKLYTMDRKLDDLDNRLRSIEKHLEKLVSVKTPSATTASTTKTAATKAASNKKSK